MRTCGRAQTPRPQTLRGPSAPPRGAAGRALSRRRTAAARRGESVVAAPACPARVRRRRGRAAGNARPMAATGHWPSVRPGSASSLCPSASRRWTSASRPPPDVIVPIDHRACKPRAGAAAGVAAGAVHGARLDCTRITCGGTNPAGRRRPRCWAADGARRWPDRPATPSGRAAVDRCPGSDAG